MEGYTKVINVLHMGCPYLPYPGGSTKRLMSLAEGIQCLGNVDQFLITPTESDCEDNNTYFSNVLRLKDINSRILNIEVFKFVKDNNVDVIVLHNSRVMLAWNLVYRWFFPKVKILVEIHSFRDEGLFKKSINKILYKSCDAIVHLSKSSMFYMKSEYGYQRNYVVYNGIDASSDFRNHHEYNLESTTYAYLGSFHQWQGINVIVDNVLHAGLEFWKSNTIHLVGDGPEYKRAVTKLSNFINSGAKIHLHGWIKQDAISSIIENVDYLLAPRPSTTATETVFPLKIVDSINFNIPLVCTDVGGLKEILFETNSAFFISKDNYYALSNFFKVKATEEEYYKIRRNLMSLANDLPTWHDSAESYRSIYNEVLREH